MSQIVTRQGAVSDEKRTESPVKDMKKKVAANTEKEKQSDKPADKPTDKPTDKKEKVPEKSAAKNSEKKESKSAEKPAEQKEKTDKPVEVKDDQKAKEDKGEKSDKAEKPEEPKKPEPKPKLNGQESHNGTHPTNGNKENGTVSSSDEEQNELVIEEQDEMFPELAYDDGSDAETFEPPTPDPAPGRSRTRRSQAQVTRTPETPRPASGKQDPPCDDAPPAPHSPRPAAAPDSPPSDDSKDPKVLKPKEDSTRKLRSSDSPKPQEKKESKDDSEKTEGKSQDAEKTDADIIVIDDEVMDDGERRKTDTNFSKSRVKVSPYRRSLRLDNTISSLAANYTGNNTTMEMDISEASLAEEASPRGGYPHSLRQVRARRSYRALAELQPRRPPGRPAAAAAAAAVSLSEQGRPTVTVVGRKRKPETEPTTSAAPPSPAPHKRARIYDRIVLPFRRRLEIVGVNSDLPVREQAAGDVEVIDPEACKQAVPLAPAAALPERKRHCIIM